MVNGLLVYCELTLADWCFSTIITKDQLTANISQFLFT